MTNPQTVNCANCGKSIPYYHEHGHLGYSCSQECRNILIHQNRIKNWSARSHCKNGHPLTIANLRWYHSPNGLQRPYCRACQLDAAKRSYRKRTHKSPSS